MSLPYEIRFGGHLWRIDATTFKGSKRVSIWPHYTAKDGSIRPGKGGLQFPPEETEAVIAALIAAAAQFH
jgi:Transcriptional Coactivator p15 (PC4)